MRYLTSDYIYPISTEPIDNGILVIEDDGTIVGLEESRSIVDSHKLEHFEGILCPGFINSHCHLELSALREKVPKGTGLSEFVRRIAPKRKELSEQELNSAIVEWDARMEEAGIVGVGDISNEARTFIVKKQSNIRYHTFVEVFGIDGSKASTIYKEALSLKEENINESCSIAPHAAYSVSRELFEQIQTQESGTLLSYHNQESEDEEKLFQTKEGEFADWFKEVLGSDLSYIRKAENSFQGTIDNIAPQHKLLLVHNTYMSESDLELIVARRETLNQQIALCLCPKANLYIEERLPSVELFTKYDIPILVGTDSLASNDSLSILEELKIISTAFPLIPLAELLKWSTINGAEFFGWKNVLGSFEKGKKPGVNNIVGLDERSISLQKNSSISIVG